MSTSDGKMETHNQVSAGGVTFRRMDGQTEIAVILTNPENRWQLPKGLIDPGETPEIAAVREVREEAGVESELLGPIDRTEYWFIADRGGKRTRFHKTVHWFLMRYIRGDVADHDHEVSEARWVNVDEALKMLVFKNERDVVSKAASMISEQN